MVIATQDQSLQIRLVKHYIDGTTDSPKYRVCGKMDENVSYMLSECNELVQNEYKNELAQNEYKNELVQNNYINELVQNEYKNELVQNEYKKLRHDKVVALLNWKWCKAHGFKTHEKYYEHFFEKKMKVLEIDKVKSCGI